MSTADLSSSRADRGVVQIGRWALDGWNRFWFTPAPPHTLALLRVLSGGMLLYTHLVWSLDLLGFLGSRAWITPNVARALHSDSYAFSYLWYVESPALLWTLHAAALLVFVMLVLGVATRVVSVLACFITLSYCHRLIGAQFGLDQVNAMMAMYLMIGASGAAYSVDSIIARRRGASWLFPDERPAVSTNIAIRLIQIHMCVIYLFGGIGKLRGDMWWDGSALWFAAGNLEYQSWDITWLGMSPVLIAALSHVTMFWETFYPALVCSRWTRPIALILAVLVHGGIAVSLGMVTFGLAMIFGNMSFLAPETTERWVRLVGSPFRKQDDSRPSGDSSPASGDRRSRRNSNRSARRKPR